MEEINLRAMRKADWPEVADLIYVSTNYWYEAHNLGAAFKGGPSSTRLHCEVYEALDPGCCILAEHPETGRIMGSCFYHPRETHVSLGIMNVHPNYFGSGIAKSLLKFIIDYAERENKPVRLISSAMNLDSFSLYTRAGFIPRAVFQDMILEVPKGGLNMQLPESQYVRDATLADVAAIATLEMEISQIHRERDYRYFIENQAGIWHTSVIENENGVIEGFLASIHHPGVNMLGPGFSKNQEQAAALILAELNVNKGRSPVFLIPVDCKSLVQKVYSWGARNCEIHFCQVYGEFHPFNGVVLPTFMPETG